MEPKLPAGTLIGLWSDPNHWRGIGVYSCKEDPRLVVPKRVPLMGWTLNFAHGSAWLVLAVTVLGIVIPGVVFARARMVGSPAWWIFLVGYVVIICVGCWILSSPKRFEESGERSR